MRVQYIEVLNITKYNTLLNIIVVSLAHQKTCYACAFDEPDAF